MRQENRHVQFGTDLSIDRTKDRGAVRGPDLVAPSEYYIWSPQRWEFCYDSAICKSFGATDLTDRQCRGGCQACPIQVKTG
jgi:hypothetical protein